MKQEKCETPKTNRKISKRWIAVIMVMVLVVGAMISGTLAFLTQKSDTYVNTFTYGDINIDLEETKGEELNGNKLTRQFKMLPGKDIEKDPIVTVEAGSEKCWLYVKVEQSANFDQFMEYEMDDGWTPLPENPGVFFREADASDSNDDLKFPVIKNNTITVKEEVTKDQLNALTDDTMPSLTVTAYAVQYGDQDALNTAGNAWNQVPQEVATADELKAALAKGGTVTLTADVQIDEQLEVTKPTILELNGKTITPTNDLWNSGTATYSVICVNGSKLTINGEGEVKAKDNDSYAIDVQNGGELIINGGTYVGNVHAVYVNTGELTVNGGKFSIVQEYTQAPNKPYEFVLNCLDKNYRADANITVNGGSFYKFNPANCQAEGVGTNFTSAGCTITQDGDWYNVTK